MPHLILTYSGNLDAILDMPRVCRDAADAMLAVRDENGSQVFPTGGTRVLAYPAVHFALADGGAAGRAAGAGKTGITGSDAGEYGFLYANLRMARGRSAATQQQAGEAIAGALRKHLEPWMATRHIGFTLQIDEGQEVFDLKFSTLHPLFKKA